MEKTITFDTQSEVHHFDPTQEPEVERDERPWMLDFFSGTGSVGETFKAQGYKVVSLDMDPAVNADIQTDILAWKYKEAYDPGHFDVIFCCSPCTEFSRALTLRDRDLDVADAIIKMTLRIVDYFRPRLWFLENRGRVYSRSALT